MQGADGVVSLRPSIIGQKRTFNGAQSGAILVGIFLNTDDDDDLSIPLDDEDLAAIAALTESDVTAIDDAILLQLNAHWQKTALVVSRAMDAYPDRYFDVPDIYYGQRVLALSAKGLMDSQGNLRRMRFSEVRAKDPGVKTS